MENNSPDNKKKSFLRIWLIFPVLVGMVLAGVATGVVIKNLTKPKAAVPSPKKTISKVMPLPEMPNPAGFQATDASAEQTVESNETDMLRASKQIAAASENQQSQPASALRNSLVITTESLNANTSQTLEPAVKEGNPETQSSQTQGLENQPADPIPSGDENAPFTIQVGVFRYEVYANRKAAQLKQIGYPSFIHEIMGKDQLPVYLVCFGRFQTKNEALPVAAVFKEKEKMEAVVAFLKPR